MDGGSMASGDDSAVKRFAGARMAALGEAAEWAGTAVDARWRAGSNKTAAFAERALETFMPRGYSLGSAAPRSQSGPDYKAIGSQIGEGLKELGLFGGASRSASRSPSSASGVGAAFGSGFNAEKATNLGWSMSGSFFS
jgi:hypothetical protein